MEGTLAEIAMRLLLLEETSKMARNLEEGAKCAHHQVSCKQYLVPDSA